MLSGVPSRDGDLGAVLRARIAGFSGFLRANGYALGGGDALDVIDVAARMGVLDRQVLRWNLKALLCGRGEEWRRFDALFDAFFLPPNRALTIAGAAPATREAACGEAAGEDPAPDRGSAGHAARYAASRAEQLAATDFRDLSAHARDVEALMRRFARRLRQLELRREACREHGRRLDLPNTIRRSVSSGGTPWRLAWKDRRRVRPRLVLLLDVSRSMSPYSFFYLRLARALTAEMPDVHSFIFHTRLTGVGAALADSDPWRAQERLHLLAAGWGGGTRIGECLRDFNRGDGARLVHSRTGVIIMSDGYDTGEPQLLAQALALLRRRARRIVWLNPLLGQRGVTLESQGMRAALPYIDLLSPGADLAGVERVLPQVVGALG